MNESVHKTTSGEIRIIDEPFEAALAENITAAFERESWHFGWASNSSDTYRFWHLDIDRTEPSKHPSSKPAIDAWNDLNIGLLKGHRLLKAYANAHIYGGEGYVHIDGQGADGYFSSVYFCHREWQVGWSGELVFFTQDRSEIEFAVVPKPRRLIVFPGMVPHAIRPPSRSCTLLRVGLVFKSLLEDGAGNLSQLQ
ncbi:MAG: 2OG-Fe(II) oxygenase [Limisphaerales bacterium]